MSPSTFFRAIPRTGGTAAAFLYFLPLAILVAGVELFWTVVLGPGDASGPWLERLGVAAQPARPLVDFLLSPLVMVGGLLLGAVLVHALLALLGGARHGLGTTIRVYCYAYSPALLAVVPRVGAIAALIWSVVLAIIGLREAHETSGMRAALAVLLPFLLVLGLIVMAVVLFLSGLLLLPA